MRQQIQPSLGPDQQHGFVALVIGNNRCVGLSIGLTNQIDAPILMLVG
jgi:hypothetical protein